ncbi:MAG: hypothetical protein P4L51_02600 [Puia sp.]|nr:hypothetical protein [Puia sp.]
MPKGLLPLSSYPCLFFALLFTGSCFHKKEQQQAPVYTGLAILKEFDKSRTFDTTSDATAPMYFRPVKIDVFYPSAEKPARPPLTYGQLLDQYEQRINYKTPIDSCRRTSQALAASIAEYLHVENAFKILGYKMDIYDSLQWPVRRSPLIIYAAGMNGSSWENPILFDSLAKRGYVVAAISSVGKYPGYMTAPIDLDEQVRDILFTRQTMSALPFIDTSRIGLLSWSLGGSSATKAAMANQDFKALLSFDGTEIHYYGTDTAWDTWYTQNRQIPPFDPGQITTPYLYLSSEHPAVFDSVYLLPRYMRSKHNYFLKLNKSIHEDFSSIVTIAKAVSPELIDIDSARHSMVCSLAGVFFDEYLKPLDEQEPPTVSTRGYINQLLTDRPASFDTTYPHR